MVNEVKGLDRSLLTFFEHDLQRKTILFERQFGPFMQTIGFKNSQQDFESAGFVRAASASSSTPASECMK